MNLKLFIVSIFSLLVGIYALYRDKDKNQCLILYQLAIKISKMNRGYNWNFRNNFCVNTMVKRIKN